MVEPSSSLLWLQLNEVHEGSGRLKPLAGKAIGRALDMPIVYREVATVTLRHLGASSVKDEPELVA